jgi:hypothetical protein
MLLFAESFSLTTLNPVEFKEKLQVAKNANVYAQA